MTLRLQHPKPETLASRDRLLTRALHSGGLPWPIADEYPLVLGKGAAEYSWCLVDDEEAEQEHAVVAHANLWPRELLGENGERLGRVGLIGNVATATRHRGQGLMARLLGDLERVAREEWGLEALLLWSDLSEFYQKLGFKSSGQERRYVYGGKVQTAAAAARGAAWRNVLPENVTNEMCAAFLACRPQGSPTLRRSPDEMRRLLLIPGITLFAQETPTPGGGWRGYAVVGRGTDMVGVVHDWGAPSPSELFGVLAAARARLKADEITLLAPAELGGTWNAELAGPTLRVEEHPMAWSKVLVDGPAATGIAQALERTFVWGLDSI